MTVALGAPAPSFSLPGVVVSADGQAPTRRDFSLAELAGAPAVLVFYPADHSPVCTVQLQTYSHDIGEFAGAGAQVLALSPQSVDEHEGFAAEHGLAFPLLADEGKHVGEAYGILGPLGFYRRSIFVIDGEGVVRYAHRATAGLTFRPVDEIVEAVAALQPT
ncbi:MAG TPA: peroxiredoxin [Acidimicrobiales bacterium]